MAAQSTADAVLAPVFRLARRNDLPTRIFASIRKSPKGIIGSIIVTLLFFLAIFGQFIAPYDPLIQDYDVLLGPPSLAHPLGADNLGRDILSRLFYGAKVSLQVGVLTIALAASIGIAAGLVCAFFRGWVDEILMRIADGIMAFPSLMLALALVAVLGPSLQSIIIAIAFGNLPKFTRVVRGQALSIVSSDYVAVSVAGRE
jgi:ABC-type dipeptide/oligopeptide/nickel transport system permease subunit